jgi:hypothetical protein
MMPEVTIFPVIPETLPPVNERIAAGLLLSATSQAEGIIGRFVDEWKAFWESPEATPEEIAVAMGPSAGLWFTLAAIMRQAIVSMIAVRGVSAEEIGVPVRCLSTPRAVTINDNGTVTLGA